MSPVTTAWPIAYVYSRNIPASRTAGGTSVPSISASARAMRSCFLSESDRSFRTRSSPPISSHLGRPHSTGIPRHSLALKRLVEGRTALRRSGHDRNRTRRHSAPRGVVGRRECDFFGSLTTGPLGLADAGWIDSVTPDPASANTSCPSVRAPFGLFRRAGYYRQLLRSRCAVSASSPSVLHVRVEAVAMSGCAYIFVAPALEFVVIGWYTRRAMTNRCCQFQRCPV